MVDLVQRVLADVDETAWEFFWRGAGRALYFSPGHMVQPLFSPWIAASRKRPMIVLTKSSARESPGRPTS